MRSVRIVNAPATRGHDLQRPECVVADLPGNVYASDGRGGVAHVAPDGSQALYLGSGMDLGEPLVPNGICVEPDGSFLVAHLGQREGGVYRLTRDGALAPYLMTVNGVELPPTNYVTRDRQGRLWVTVSTTKRPRSLDYRRDASSGFIVMDDGSGARIVADGLRYTNECAVSPDGAWLYANETFGKALVRFPLHGDGTLGEKEIVHEFGPGEFPDGLAFDRAGGIWIACIFANRVIRLDAEGRAETWLDGEDPDHVATIEGGFATNTLTAEHMASAGRSPFGNSSSIAFGGPDRRTAYVGSLQGRQLLTFRTPYGGYLRDGS